MSKKIIVVDDSDSTRQAVGTALSDAGYQVFEAVDGVDGLATIERNVDAALVICDINMPNMNGLEMVEALRRGAHGRDTPIVMLTTEVQADLVARAKAAGVKGWIVKPFKHESFLATVRKLVGPA